MEPSVDDLSKARPWPWRRQRKQSIDGQETAAPELVEHAATIEPPSASPVPDRIPMAPAARTLAPPRISPATPGPKGGDIRPSILPLPSQAAPRPVAIPQPAQIPEPVPSSPHPPAATMGGKVPCSRCGEPSERGLCEACLDAIAELRQLSTRFGL